MILKISPKSTVKPCCTCDQSDGSQLKMETGQASHLMKEQASTKYSFQVIPSLPLFIERKDGSWVSPPGDSGPLILCRLGTEEYWQQP